MMDVELKTDKQAQANFTRELIDWFISMEQSSAKMVLKTNH
jgi:hypothetical protein